MKKRNNFFMLEWQTSSMNKEAKILSALQPRYSNVSLFHPKRWLHVNELESQLMKFPNAKHDDVVDGLAMAVMMLNSFGKTRTSVVRWDRLWWDVDPKARLQKLKQKSRNALNVTHSSV